MRHPARTGGILRRPPRLLLAGAAALGLLLAGLQAGGAERGALSAAAPADRAANATPPTAAALRGAGSEARSAADAPAAARPADPMPTPPEIRVAGASEKDRLERLVPLPLAELEREADRRLTAPASTAERVAALRALEERDAPSANAFLARALREGAASAEDDARVRDYAARRLGVRAEADREARAALRDVLCAPTSRAPDAALRMRLAERLGATAAAGEVASARTALASDPHPLVRRAFENGLAQNPHLEP